MRGRHPRNEDSACYQGQREEDRLARNHQEHFLLGETAVPGVPLGSGCDWPRLPSSRPHGLWLFFSQDVVCVG